MYNLEHMVKHLYRRPSLCLLDLIWVWNVRWCDQYVRCRDQSYS